MRSCRRRPRAWLLALAVLALPFVSSRADDAPATAPTDAMDAEPESRWGFYHPFFPCEGRCSVAAYFGQSSSGTAMRRVFSDGLPPWDWEWDGSYLFGAAVARDVITYGDDFDIEAELGAGKRFGEMTEGEFWLAIYFRWHAFPWNGYLRTSIAISTGLNLATGISDAERRKAAQEGSDGSNLMHYLSPEVTFGLPQYPNVDLLVRWHHRSGVFGTFNGAHGGVHFLVGGLRYHF